MIRYEYQVSETKEVVTKLTTKIVHTIFGSYIATEELPCEEQITRARRYFPSCYHPMIELLTDLLYY